MAQIVAQFFNMIGPDITPPTNMQELIPYLLTVFVGVFLLASVFRMVVAIVTTVLNARRF